MALLYSNRAMPAAYSREFPNENNSGLHHAKESTITCATND